MRTEINKQTLKLHKLISKPAFPIFLSLSFFYQSKWIPLVINYKIIMNEMFKFIFFLVHSPQIKSININFHSILKQKEKILSISILGFFFSFYLIMTALIWIDCCLVLDVIFLFFLYCILLLLVVLSLWLWMNEWCKQV